MRVFTSECTRDTSSPGIIRILKAVFFTAFAFALAASPAIAQTSAAGTGTVVGRVLNATNGTYLNNARVSLEGSERAVFTNQYGEYAINNVSAGAQKVRVFFTGFESKVTDVTVVAGKTVTADLSLGVAAADDTVVLDAFTVSAGRETNIAQIATNEQRFAPNVKTVIETNAFGDVTEGNTGEFLKFLPGVTVEYVAADVRTVNVRGFASSFTTVSIDGFPAASAASGSATRSFEFEQVSINNASRVEITKVPTPDVPSNTLGGNVNMISKNAFEREGRALNYRAYLNANSEDIIPWDRSPGPKNKSSYKVLPGFDFDYTIPITKKFGLVVTGLSSNQFNEQHRSQSLWNFNKNGATALNPYLQQYQLQDGPKNSFRDSASIRGDWKISPGQSLSFTYQVNYYASFFGNRNLTWDLGTTGGSDLTWGPTFTNGPTGTKSVVKHGSAFRDKFGLANTGNVIYNYAVHGWVVDAGLSYSHSRSWYRDTDRGHFNNVGATLNNVSRVFFTDIQNPRPAEINVVNKGGQQLDAGNLSNYTLSTVSSSPLTATDKFETGHFNVKRRLNGLPFDVSIKLGANMQKEERDIRRKSTAWTFVGPDGVAGTADDNAAQYADSKYGVYPGWGFDHVTWTDPYKIYQEFVDHPSYFYLSPAATLNAEKFRLRNSQKLDETIFAPYAMLDSHFLDNRLGVIAGVRYEKTDDKGNGVLAPTIGATLADVQANWKERGEHTKKSYDGFYPSVNMTYNVTDDFIIRLAYARTFGRPDLSQILPLTRINIDPINSLDDGSGTIPPQTIIYNNPALIPYQANNYDLSLEYYFHNGGVVSVGGFMKDVKNFFGKINGTATAQDLDVLGLSSDYIGFDTQTTINIPGTTKINGIEFSYRQPLTFLPGWGRFFTVFANATRLYLSGPNDAAFTTFIPKAGNVGVSFSRKKLTLRLNVNYRGRELNSIQTSSNQYNAVGGPFREYYGARFNVDVNAGYQLSKRLSLFANARNLFDQPQDLERYNPTSPAYSHLYRREKFGTQITMGVKGTF